MKTYLAAQLFDGEHMHKNMRMRVNKGLIVDITHAANNREPTDIPLDGIVCAGFVDIQVNGGGGVLFNDEQTPQAISAIVKGHCQFGSTSILPTLITDSAHKMQCAADAVHESMAMFTPGIVGIHFEGPHLSIAKKGIHSAQHVRTISDTELAIVTRKDIGKVLLTLAPENVPADVISDLVKQGVVVSLGHSGANIDEVLLAIEAGAHCFTHLFNAMSGLTARCPGMIGAALSDNRISAGLIADLHHVHPQNLKLAYQCLGPKRLLLVTDAMAHVGSKLQTLPWLDSTITRQNGKLTLDDGSLAGSCLDMAGAVKNMFTVLSQNIPVDEHEKLLGNVFNMASAAPANTIGLNDAGVLKTSQQADFVLLNNELCVQGTWIKGKQVFANGKALQKY